MAFIRHMKATELILCPKLLNRKPHIQTSQKLMQRSSLVKVPNGQENLKREMFLLLTVHVFRLKVKLQLCEMP